MKQYKLTSTNPYSKSYESNNYLELLHHAVNYSIGERDTDGCRYVYTITDMTLDKSITYTAAELSNTDDPRCPWDCPHDGSYGSLWRRCASLDAAEAFGVTVDEILYPYDEEHDVTDMMEAMRKEVK